MLIGQSFLSAARSGALLAVCGVLAWGQAASTPATPSTGSAPATGGPAGIGNTGSTTRPGRSTMPSDTQQPQMPEMPRTIFLSGKVVLEDGTPPPDSVTIERVCNGSPRPEGYTDSKGRFSFELGRNSALMADASTANSGIDGFDTAPGMNRGRGSNSMGGFPGRNIEQSLMGCELRASLAGFRSEAVSLSGRRMLDNPDVGTIILRRLANVEGFTFSATSGLAPKDARKAFEKGRDLIRKKKFPEAQKELEKATSLYPKYAVAWYDLGRIHEQAGAVEPARKAFESSIAADSKYVNPYLNLSGMYARESNWPKTAELTAAAIRLNPFEYPQIHFYHAVASLNLHDLDAAEKSAREAKKMDTKKMLTKIDYLLGVILTQKRDIPGAATSLRAYLTAYPDAAEAADVRRQLEQIEKAMAAAQ